MAEQFQSQQQGGAPGGEPEADDDDDDEPPELVEATIEPVSHLKRYPSYTISANNSCSPRTADSRTLCVPDPRVCLVEPQADLRSTLQN